MSIRSSRYVLEGEVDPGMAAMARYLVGAVTVAGATLKDDSLDLSDEEAWLLASKWGSLSWEILDTAGFKSEARTGFRGPLGKIKKNWDAAKEGLANMKLPEESIEALLFFRGNEGADFVQALQDQKESGLTSEVVKDTARAIASSVPPLGKKWLRDRFIREGTPVAEAIEKANSIYANGGNLMAYEAQDERRKMIAALLRLRDPGVTDEQIEKVVASPMTLEQAKAAFAPSTTGGPRTEGPRSGTTGTTGATGAGAGGEGGGMGLLLVGAAVVLGFIFLKK